MSEEDFLELISKIPREENDRTLSTYGSINVEDLQNAVKRFKKIPDYEELLKENKDLQQRIDKAIEFMKNGIDGKGQSYVDFVRYVSIDDDKKILDILQGKEMK